jgi:hypothetical protein
LTRQDRGDRPETPDRRRNKIDSKHQFRSGKPATQSLHQIGVDIAAMRAAPPCGRRLSRRINGRTDITLRAPSRLLRIGLT